MGILVWGSWIGNPEKIDPDRDPELGWRIGE